MSKVGDTISARALATLFDMPRGQLQNRLGSYKRFQVCAGYWSPVYANDGTNRLLHYELITDETP